MAEREYALAFLAAEPRIPSRTMLQKLVYLAAIEDDAAGSFRAYFYGPYSAELQQEVERLVAAGVIDEDARRLEPWESGPFEPMQYTYELTPEGRGQASELPHELRTRANHIVATAKQVGAMSPGSLSLAAKVRYLRSLDPSVADTDAPELARQFGWRMSPDEARRGARLLAELDR